MFELRFSRRHLKRRAQETLKTECGAARERRVPKAKDPSSPNFTTVFAECSGQHQHFRPDGKATKLPPHGKSRPKTTLFLVNKTNNGFFTKRVTFS